MSLYRYLFKAVAAPVFMASLVFLGLLFVLPNPQSGV